MKLSDFPLEKQLLSVHDWIKSADQKISIAFALINGILIAVSIPLTKIILANISLITQPLLFILLSEFIILYTISEIYALRALIPKITSEDSKSSLLFFGSIATLTSSQYKERIAKLSAMQLQNDYISQITICSEIALKKHSRLTGSLLSFAFAIFFLIVFLTAFLAQIPA